MTATPRHESVLALLRAYPGETDPAALIRRLAREKVAKAKGHGWGGPPFCPKQLCSIFDIRCREVTHDIGGDGRLLLQRGKLWIEFHADRLPERKRFTIFHEFAHTLFPDYCEWVPLHHAAPRTPLDPEREFENLCDMAAAEMLFPRAEFLRDLNAQPFGFTACDHLRTTYEASLDATLRRMVDLAETIPCCAAFLTDVRHNRDGDGPLWVKSVTRSSACRGFVWPGTTPPAGSVAIQCLSGRERLPLALETWTINGRQVSFRVEAARLPEIPTARDYPKVVILIFE